MNKKIYIVIVVVIFLIAVMIAQLLFGSNSIPRQEQVKEQIATYQAQVDSLQKVIEQHQIEIERLTNDSLYKESVLRTRYGMSRKGEKVFQMVK